MLAAWRVVQSVPVSEPSDPKRSPGLLLAAEDVDNESRLRNGVGPPPLTPDEGKRERKRDDMSGCAQNLGSSSLESQHGTRTPGEDRGGEDRC